MDRQLVYPSQILPETTLLQMAKDAMVGMARLAGAVLGLSTSVNGLGCAPTTPTASMNVVISPGEIYALNSTDATAFSSLGTDSRTILKQGILYDALQLAIAAPGTVGQSINYLIQAGYQDIDSGLVTIPYYNSANPSQPYSGPNNTGTQQYTSRKASCVVTAKAGTAAATGTQTTPAPDSGNVGLWVVTVAYGATSIIAGNITSAPGAPFLPYTMAQLALLAPISNPIFTGNPRGPTPAQFDNTTSLATTAYVTATGDRCAGVTQLTGTPSAVTLTAANANQLVVVVGGSGVVITMPAVSSVPGGTKITILNVSGNSVTVQRAGADAISTTSAGGTSVTLANNAHQILVGNGGGTWWGY